MSKTPIINTLKEFKTIIEPKFTKGKQLALFMDYDGTLAPLVKDSRNAAMCTTTAEVLKELSVNPNVFLAVISGREINDIKSRIGITSMTYSGNHGFQIAYPDGSIDDYPVSNKILDDIHSIVAKLNESINIPGSWVEDKKLSVSVHYRALEPQKQEEVRTGACKIVKSFGFDPLLAHNAVEVKPPVEWNKGSAVLKILQKYFGDDWYENVNVVFSGDDVTDEDAMKAIKKKGLSFRVGLLNGEETNADYVIESTENVTVMLQWLQKVFKNK